jgi:hypothetical protein
LSVLRTLGGLSSSSSLSELSSHHAGGECIGSSRNRRSSDSFEENDAWAYPVGFGRAAAAAAFSGWRIDGALGRRDGSWRLATAAAAAFLGGSRCRSGALGLEAAATLLRGRSRSHRNGEIGQGVRNIRITLAPLHFKLCILQTLGNRILAAGAGMRRVQFEDGFSTMTRLTALYRRRILLDSTEGAVGVSLFRS